jgi:plastocyanin
MQIHPLAAVTVAMAIAVGLGACGGGQAPTGAEIRIAGTEMAFSPHEVTTGVGRHRVVFANDGAAYHELAIVSPAGTVLAARSAPAGQTAAFDVVLEAPGRYRLVCREPGHTAAGMAGALTVTR